MRQPRRKRLFWRLSPSYLLITLVALVAVSAYALYELNHFHRQQLSSGLEVRASLVREQLRTTLAADPGGNLADFCAAMGAQTRTRITVILPDGTVACDSAADADQLDNHLGRPEVRQALAEGIGRATRYSHSVLERMMYVALPVRRNGEPQAVIRSAVSVAEIESTLAAVAWEVSWAGFVVLLIAAGLSLWVSKRLSRPLEELQRGAERIAAGELKPLPEPDVAEIGALAAALNTMVAELDQQLQTMSQQRNELEGVLNSMVEGVLAVDVGERVVKANPAACDLLGLDPAELVGRSIQEVVRNPDLQRFVTSVLGGEEVLKEELVVRTGPASERVIQLGGSRLKDPSGDSLGALVVLTDVTQLRRLESVRRDFVANVSHELKTPITSIKGFTETLLDGAIDDPEHAARFLAIIDRQVDRLSQIIEDLLSLARIERIEEGHTIELTEADLYEIIRAAVDTCDRQAQEREILVEVACVEGLHGRLNPPLFEQALTNLLTNAIKYSEPGSRVRVSCDRQDGELIVRVTDWGPGIPAQHVERLFERFYRVDPSRSREQGGTGLGLSIVKHIMQAHGGQVTVTSTPGHGSTFHLHLPGEVRPTPESEPV